MRDPDEVQRAREWLERQSAELGQLRNANRRDSNFKTWRQQTLTVIQRVWPGDTRRVERFRRIPFSSPLPHPTPAQVREGYERGWGEAGVLLRELLAEINLLGLPQRRASPGVAPAPASEPDSLPSLAGPDAPEPARAPLAVDDGWVPTGRAPERDADAEVGRAMDRLLGRSHVLREGAPDSPATADALPEPGGVASDLVRVAGELEALGLSPARAVPVRAALLALAREADAEAPTWELVSEVLAHSGATPALARRILPALRGLVERAA